MKDVGTFVALPDLLAKTIPYVEDVLESFKASPTLQTAIDLRQACILSCVAGDSMANLR